jgi:hypothetical protein
MKTLLNKVTMEWLKAAAIRALRTVAQTALGMMTIGAAVNEVNWAYVASVSVVAAVYSLLTSLVTTLPEIATDGQLQIDTTGDKDIYRLVLNTELSQLSAKTHVNLTVEDVQNLTQE